MNTNSRESAFRLNMRLIFDSSVFYSFFTIVTLSVLNLFWTDIKIDLNTVCLVFCFYFLISFVELYAHIFKIACNLSKKFDDDSIVIKTIFDDVFELNKDEVNLLLNYILGYKDKIPEQMINVTERIKSDIRNFSKTDVLMLLYTVFEIFIKKPQTNNSNLMETIETSRDLSGYMFYIIESLSIILPHRIVMKLLFKNSSLKKFSKVSSESLKEEIQ